MTTNLAAVADKTFDYVIAGGGTAGLTLANRLTEDPSISVVVLEAGEPNVGDSKIVVPGQFGATFGDPKYDWWFPTTKQKYSKDRVFNWARGKGLGGSSCMNFYAWSKPPAGDVDAIEKLGNPGWNWKSYFEYTKRSETFHKASNEQLAAYPHTVDPDHRGTNGPIQTTVPHAVATIDALFQETMVKKGIKAIKDPYGGDITGTWMAAANLDPKTWTRSYAVTAYYLPAKDRKNLTVLTGATASRVLFSDKVDGKDLTATGVEFLFGSKPYTVHASKEVILSAGTIKSPQILELSGVGRSEVLSSLGIDVKIDLPGVGENVSDHVYLGASYELDGQTAHETYDRMRDPAYAAEAFALRAKGQGMARIGITSFAYIPISAATSSQETKRLYEKAEADVEKQKKALGDKIPPSLEEQLKLQLKTLKDDTLPDLEFIAFPGFFTTETAPESGKSYVTILIVLNHPFSRGTIHAVSRNPMDQPEIDPHYFENDSDLENLVQHIKFIKSMENTEPWKSGTVKALDPAPNCTTDPEIREYILNNHGTCWHTIGSCSMLPREKHGVVDPKLKVYGTTNLRVVDISVIPIHIAAHTHATAYVIGEKAADIIRGRV
ncbi:GMC oxidoreductase [Stereum hirsutum FP-91666 SS1]|uniref:GMC oxidoreductase n=1 Tax=Stereum hirsutum (strain FP-91666) TaxID=721885 RepID=UPI000444A465|nr:GMC oxidoreductase [Stereum hirsutum FP-91666 SS1]EIM84584.1 GMC oxidoreductase [Stereum hirsutum FP-91666 SS1]